MRPTFHMAFWRLMSVLTLLAVVVLTFSTGVAFALAASWDGTKVQQENERWKASIDMWGQLAREWDMKREARLETLYGTSFSGIDGRRHCNDRGCWSEDLFGYTFSSVDGDVSEVSKSRGNAMWQYGNGDQWENRNGGQSMQFRARNGIFWDSSNFGQVIEYQNQRGDQWSSGNFGQSLEYRGADGERWTSSNFGQNLQHAGSDGTFFEDSNFGQTGTFFDEDGAMWDLQNTR